MGHHHPCGSDRLVKAESRGWSWHRHALFGGTTIARAVPTWLQTRGAKRRGGTDVSDEHRRAKGGAPLSPARCHRQGTATFRQKAWLSKGVTAMVTVVHHPFSPGAALAKGGTAMVTTIGVAVQHPIFLETWFLRGIAGWSLPPLGQCHRHLVRCPNG